MHRESLVLSAAIEGPIGPASVRHVSTVIATARERSANILILRLNTPGGLATSMREIIALLLGSPVPVVGYVAPPGAHAASAGTYILYAAHLAAMAPGTNLGAATPVQIGGGFPGLPSKDRTPRDDAPGDTEPADSPDDALPRGGDSRRGSPTDPMTDKAVNDAVAFIRSLAQMHGRNAQWAEKAVREAASLSAREAFEAGVIDFLAEDIGDLLAKADGRSVNVAGTHVEVATSNAVVEEITIDTITRLLAVLANPNVAFILLIVGIYGLIFEFSNPGSIGPGVVGVICLVLGLYALNQLPLDYAGLALLVLGIAFMIAEAFTPTFGVLGAGGLVAFTLGAAMLIDTEVPEYQLSWWVIGVTAAVSAAFLIFLVGYLWRVYRRPGRWRTKSFPNAEAEVLDWSDGTGHVWAAGERWNARGDSALAPGQKVRVRDRKGLTLVVEPAERLQAARGD